MIDELIELLETFGYPVYRQGSMAEDEAYPLTFITFWDYPEEEGLFYDNDENMVLYDFQVNIYSADPNKPYDLLDEVRDAMKDAGWTVSKRAFSLESDEPTHTGRGFEAVFCRYK